MEDISRARKPGLWGRARPWMRLFHLFAGLFLLVGTLFLTTAPSPESSAASGLCTPTNPCSVFGGGPITGDVDSGDTTKNLRLAMRFTVTRPLLATGVRFYKAAANTGTHTGVIYSAESGSTTMYPLATTTFAGESSTGWQTARFAAPVQLVPNKHYVVGYSALNGHYSSHEYFNWNTTNSQSPVRTIAETNSGWHSSYGNIEDFPGNNFHDTNYWVDILTEDYLNVVTPSGFLRSDPVGSAVDRNDPIEIGMRFIPTSNTRLLGIRGWNDGSSWEVPSFRLWKADGTLLHTSQVEDLDGYPGWYEIWFESPVDLVANTEYRVTSFIRWQAPSGEFSSGDGRATANAFTTERTVGVLRIPANAGVHKVTGNWNFDPVRNFPSVLSSTNYWVEPIVGNEAGTQMLATVNPALTFTSTGVPSGSTCGDVTTTAATTATGGVFDTLVSTSQRSVLGQSINVVTNAAQGYTVGVKALQPMTGLTSGRTYGTVSGTNASPSLWPANDTEAFGYQTSWTALSGGSPGRFQPNRWAAPTGSLAEVMHRTGLTTEAGDTACIAYGISMSNATPAETYQARITALVTPRF